MEALFSRHLKIISALTPAFTNSLMHVIPWQEQLVGITGARGVGKTTMILQYIKAHYAFNRTALYVSLDDISFPFKSLVELAEEFSKHGGIHLFIDEIHKFPTWSQELKNIYDLFPNLKLTFTGSSILDMQKGQTDLSRRALMFTMHGLSFRQFIEIETGQQLPVYSLTEIISDHSAITAAIFQKIQPFKFFNDYLHYGYYPFYLQNRDFYSMKLSNIINQIIEVDFPMLKNVDRQYISKIKRLVNLLANEIPVKPNVSAIAASLGASWQSIINYIQYLDQAKILHIIYPAGKNVSALAKPEKIYLHHPNLMFVFKNEIMNRGSLRESFFANQLCYSHSIQIPAKGDFIVDGKYTFEIGGKGKKYAQISGIDNSFIAADDIEFGFENKIPLWLFGFLY